MYNENLEMKKAFMLILIVIISWPSFKFFISARSITSTDIHPLLSFMHLITNPNAESCICKSVPEEGLGFCLAAVGTVLPTLQYVGMKDVYARCDLNM